ncbi:MAG: ParA family protein [Candidatus Accumulibacter sp.]|jgi:chromosome partitioning protein|nr:ParA family protein [Accumulibacter sp.]
MKSFLIANPKGGSGKTTLATNLAGYFAQTGRRAMLGDIDRQGSSRAWLSIRPAILPAIAGWSAEKGEPLRPPNEATHVVLDSPAGLRGKALEKALKQVSRVIVPVQPSLFDILATRDFLDALLAEKAVRKERAFVAVVGMRVDARTRAAGELERFLADCGAPVLGHIRDSQLYVQLAAHGMSLFDLTPSRAGRDLEEWRPILDWAEG